VAVDGDDLLAGSQLGFVCGAAPTDVGDGAVGGEAQAEGEPDVGTGVAAAGVELGGVILVDELVAAAGDAVEIDVRVDEVYAVVEEAGPIVLDDFVEVADDLGAVVGNDKWAGVSTLAEEDVLEVGEGFLVVGKLADPGVGVEPKELAFGVEVLAAAPVGPCLIAATEDAAGDCGVVGGAPEAAGFVVEHCGDGGEVGAVLLV